MPLITGFPVFTTISTSLLMQAERPSLPLSLPLPLNGPPLAIQPQNPIHKTDSETAGLLALLFAAAGVAVSWLRRGPKPALGRTAEEEGDPYRSPGRTNAPRSETVPASSDENFAFEIPRTHSRMDFENVTLSPRVRLDTKLDFHKLRNAWWLSRREHGRCSVQLQVSRNGNYEVMKPKVLYPVRFDELLKVNDEFFSLTIERTPRVFPDPFPDLDVTTINRQILKGNLDAIRHVGACVGMIEEPPTRAGELLQVGIPSAAFAYLHRSTGQILALVHNGRHPRPYEGVPPEIRSSALPVRFDLMVNDRARANDRRHIARYQVQGHIPEAMRPFLDALAGQMFQPFDQVIDARRMRALP